MLAAGRWHTTRRLVTYASESLALASLEVLMHCDLDLLPSDLLAVEIEIPTETQVAELTTSDLPRACRRYPAPRALQELGNHWLDEAATAVLRVPSAVVPTECDYLINPLHPDIKEIRVVRRSRFAIDERLAFEGKPAKSALQRAAKFGGSLDQLSAHAPAWQANAQTFWRTHGERWVHLSMLRS